MTHVWRTARRSQRVRASALMSGVLLASLLTACSAPPAGYTDAELDDWVELQNQSQWASQPYQVEAQRPEVEVVRFLNADEFRVVYECMADAGLPVEFTADGGISWSIADDAPDSVALAEYTCNAQYPFYPPQVGSFTDEQHAYLYDYYQDVLVPCLLMEGYTVKGEAPSRAEFTDVTTVDSFWSPYSFIDYPSEYDELEALWAKCPSVPFRAPLAD